MCLLQPVKGMPESITVNGATNSAQPANGTKVTTPETTAVKEPVKVRHWSNQPSNDTLCPCPLAFTASPSSTLCAPAHCQRFIHHLDPVVQAASIQVVSAKGKPVDVALNGDTIHNVFVNGQHVKA
jgi:hypothetical protein